MRKILTIILFCSLSTICFAQFNTGQLVLLVDNSVEQLETAQKQLSFAQKTYERAKKINNVVRTVNDINSLIYNMKRTVNSLTTLSRTVTSNKNKFSIDYYTRLINEISYFTDCLTKTATDTVNLLSENKFEMNDSERLNELRKSLDAMKTLSTEVSSLERATKNVVTTSNLNKIFL